MAGRWCSRSSGSAPTWPPGPNTARYYRHVLHHSLLAGATGWIAWNNTDFDLPGQDPYPHHAFEQHFGLTDAAARPKPALAEMCAFAAVLDTIQASRCTRADTDTALIVPAYLDTRFPFTDPRDAARIAVTLAQAYVSARLAGHPGPSYGRLDQAFGVRHGLDVGLPDPIADEVAVLRLQRDFGALARGWTVQRPGQLSPWIRSASRFFP